MPVTHTPSSHNLRHPESPILLRPEKPKGWVWRLSMPVVGAALSLDTKKNASATSLKLGLSSSTAVDNAALPNHDICDALGGPPAAPPACRTFKQPSHPLQYPSAQSHHQRMRRVSSWSKQLLVTLGCRLVNHFIQILLVSHILLRLPATYLGEDFNNRVSLTTPPLFPMSDPHHIQPLAALPPDLASSIQLPSITSLHIIPTSMTTLHPFSSSQESILSIIKHAIMVILSSSDPENDDTISSNPNPMITHPPLPSPGLPPEMPLPSPKRSIFNVLGFCASVIDKDYTKKSFDPTGELKKLNESAIAKSLSATSLSGDESTILKSIFAKAIEIPSPPSRVCLKVQLSSAGFDSFTEVKRGFESHDNRPNFYPPPGTTSRSHHNRRESMFSIASISSYAFCVLIFIDLLSQTIDVDSTFPARENRRVAQTRLCSGLSTLERHRASFSGVEVPNLRVVNGRGTPVKFWGEFFKKSKTRMGFSAWDCITEVEGNLDHPDANGAFRYLKRSQTHILSKDDDIAKKWTELLKNDPAIALRCAQMRLSL
ncbi:hypothetical protein M405DRAFT_862618 [Rhizopogon salebrosus TDB-379]|nr:hypothetical protein M405DRAFT_862618 [Rhizopogon salebrosus TDB-379]